jgi:hypothetical protein
MSLISILVVVLLLGLIFGLLPNWNYSRSWGYGYYPSGILLVLLIVVLFVAVSGRVTP